MSALDKQISGTHYKDMPIQPIEFITKNKLDWYQGNIVKYASRHHSNGGADDLRKVIHYAELALEDQYGLHTFTPGPIKELDPITISAPECPPESEWIEWKGGDCPVSPKTLVEYLLRDGYRNGEPAGSLTWKHCGMGYDIVAYRIPKA